MEVSLSKELVWPRSGIWILSPPFERTSKRRRGFPERSSREARRSHGSRWRDGVAREARPQWPLPLRLRPPVSRSVACRAVSMMAPTATTIVGA